VSRLATYTTLSTDELLREADSYHAHGLIAELARRLDAAASQIECLHDRLGDVEEQLLDERDRSTAARAEADRLFTRLADGCGDL
jgi:uncharacterized membrane protein